MSTLRILALVFGIIFVLVGFLGFVPAAVINGNLLGIFSVNFLHNIIHIVSGVLALLSAYKESLAKLFFQVFGIIYGIVTLLGFFMAGGMVFGMHMNLADNFLHLFLAVVFLYLGFFFKGKTLPKS